MRCGRLTLAQRPPKLNVRAAFAPPNPFFASRAIAVTSSVEPVRQPQPQGTDKPAGSELRVALAQIAPLLGDRQQNLEKHRQQIAAARREQADLVIFPELSLTGYFLRDMVPEVALHRTSLEIIELVEAAGPMALVAGFVEEGEGHQFYNAALFAESDRVLHVHRKVYLPTYGLFEEQRYFSAGRRFQAFHSARFGRVGLVICEDLWHVSSATIMQAEEVDVLICIINSPARGIDGPKIGTAETYELLARHVFAVARSAGDRGESRGLRGRAVLLWQQHGRGARRADHRPGAAV